MSKSTPRTCRYPGCTATLSHKAPSGLCRRHNHAKVPDQPPPPEPEKSPKTSVTLKPFPWIK